MVVKVLTKKNVGNDKNLVSNFLYSVYRWRNDIQDMICEENKNWELQLINWWLIDGRNGYPNCDVSVGLTSQFILNHVYNFSPAEKKKTKYAPYSELFKDVKDDTIEFGTKEYHNWLFQWAYPSIIKCDSYYNRIKASRILSWAYNHVDTLVSKDFISYFEGYLRSISVIFNECLNDIPVDIDSVESGLAPFSLMFKESNNICFEIGTKEFNDWLLLWGYQKIIQKDSRFELIILGRILYWAYTNENILVSSDAIKQFEKYITSNIFDPNEGLKNYSSNFAYTVTIFGEPELSIGIGIDAKLTKRTLDEAGISNQFYKSSHTTYSPINIFSTPAPSAMVYLAELDRPEIINLSHNILSCPSEHKVWPECNNFLLDFFDNIWVHSDFVYTSLPENIKNKAQVVPLPVEILGAVDENISTIFFAKYKRIFSIPSYKFIVSFDLCSSVARKNPYAAIDAFNLAFGNERKDISLIIKLNNGDLRPELAQEVESYCSGVNNIHIINERISFDELLVLYNSIDCYVSLHRSEGFGRNIAEMMLLQKPVLVTAFSGNMDFNNNNNSWLVPYTLVEMRSHEYLYAEGQVWANADVETAAELMVEIYNSHDLSTKVDKAFQTIVDNYSIETCAKKYKNILEDLV